MKMKMGPVLNSLSGQKQPGALTIQTNKIKVRITKARLCHAFSLSHLVDEKNKSLNG